MNGLFYSLNSSDKQALVIIPNNGNDSPSFLCFLLKSLRNSRMLGFTATLSDDRQHPHLLWFLGTDKRIRRHFQRHIIIQLQAEEGYKEKDPCKLRGQCHDRGDGTKAKATTSHTDAEGRKGSIRWHLTNVKRWDSTFEEGAPISSGLNQKKWCKY